MPYGRGGAGNIEYANAITSEALKTSQARAEGKDEPSPLTATLSHDEPTLLPQYVRRPDSDQPSTYALSGRGGAGNWYDKRDLARDGTFATSSDGGGTAPVDIPKQDDGSLAGAFRGRGGAGNFAGESDPAADNQHDTRRLPDEEQASPAPDLPKEPEKAWLGGRVRSSDDRFADGLAAPSTL